MAVTSIWRVNGWLGKVVVYVENPEKTANPEFYDNGDMTERECQGLDDVIAYAVNSRKTEQNKEDSDVVERFVIPDEPAVLKHHLIRLADSRQVDLVVTSGGTGFSMRDQTPEATLAVADRNAPGIAEYIRMKSMQITDRSMLSRGASVIRKKTLIVNLPGSPKAVKESLGFILGALDHGLKILRGTASECARK